MQKIKEASLKVNNNSLRTVIKSTLMSLGHVIAYPLRKSRKKTK